jgi:hypothetical protein
MLQSKIENAKDILRDAGYYVDNLWHINDIMNGFKCTDDVEAYRILNKVMTSEQTAVHIFEQIGLIIEAK